MLKYVLWCFQLKHREGTVLSTSWTCEKAMLNSFLFNECTYHTEHTHTEEQSRSCCRACPYYRVMIRIYIQTSQPPLIFNCFIQTIGIKKSINTLFIYSRVHITSRILTAASCCERNRHKKNIFRWSALEAADFIAFHCKVRSSCSIYA